MYQFPWVEQRLSWRIDIAQTYLRGVFQPVKAVPTPLSAAKSPSNTINPSGTPSHTPTPTQAITETDFKDTESIESTSIPPSPTLSPTPQYTHTAIPEIAKLPAPAWEKQDWNNCGPAALSMYLNYYGWEGDQFNISSVLKPTREDRNVNVEELAHFARNYAGWLHTQYRVGGDINLLKAFIAAEIPIMIETSFYFDGPYWPNDDLWAAHYLLVTGYDDSRNIFTVQDTFYGLNQVLSYTKLDEYWQPFNRVFIMVYLPHQEETVKTILGSDWDEAANRQKTLDSAQAEVDANPTDAFAWFNLGTNLVYFEQYEEASAAYDEARTIGWPQRMLRYQFGPFFAYYHAGRTEDVFTLTEYALQRTPNSEEALLWRGWARYRQGDYNGAVEDFQSALDANYLYQDAKYALEFVTGQ